MELDVLAALHYNGTTCANTAVNYLMSQYPNTWSFAAPGISDSNVGIYSFTAEASHLEMWESSAMSSYEICLCLEDGLLRMVYSPMKLYIPNLDWDALHNSVSDSTLYNHLVKYDVSCEEVEVEDPAELLQEMVLKFIDISADEFKHFVPLTSYGLNSLSAARLSTALKPYMSITQIQLLGDWSLDDLVAKMRDAKRSGTDPITTNGSVTATNPTNSTEAPFAWDSLHQPGQNALKLVISTGTPLILIHGGAGDITAFCAIQEQFSTPLWAIQPTPETPMDSIEVLANYYFGKIKEKRPAGPYRIAGFSASSLVTLRLAGLFLENGDEIVQLTFVDHFPMLFASPLHDFNTTPESFEELGHLAALKTVDMISDSCTCNKTAARRAYGLALVSASQNLPSTSTALKSWTYICKIAVMNLGQAISFSGGFEVWSGLSPVEREEKMRVRMIEEVRSVGSKLGGCRISVYVADWGLRTLMPDDWNDFGVGRCFGDGRLGGPRAGVDERKAKVYRYPAGHFNIFERLDFSRSLEVDWVDAAIEAGQEREYEWKSMVHHPLKDDLTTMFRILDTMALKYMKESIEQNPVVDSEISRQRLYRETLEYLRTGKPAVWTEEEYTGLKSIYPLYFETTERIGSVHASTFQSPTAAIAALYADNMIDGWYLNNPGFMPINIEATKRFKSLVSSPSFRAHTGSEPLRVLEVGAGVGGLTTFLVETLADLQHSSTQPVNVEYTITDLSYSLAASLASSFSIPSPSSSSSAATSRNTITLLAKQYDVSKPPSFQSQSFPRASYDIITALNVIHAVPDLNETLKGLYALLRPGGKLLVVDSDGKAYRDYVKFPLRDPRTGQVVFEPPTEGNANQVPVLESVPRPGAVWADFVWGSFQGWFGFTDDRAHCTVDGEEWRRRLEGGEVGFESGSVRVTEEDVGICILLEVGKSEA